jgi:glycerate-2-kinase
MTEPLNPIGSFGPVEPNRPFDTHSSRDERIRAAQRDRFGIGGQSESRRVGFARSIWQSGVDAVLGDRAVESHVSLDDDFLYAGDLAISRQDFDRVVVVGAGKATAAMAAGLVRTLEGKVPVRGNINVPSGTADGLNLGDIHVCDARPPGVNEPTETAVAGTRAILGDVAAMTPRDLCIVLLSGGGSALLVTPADGITLADKLAVTRHLSASGASIHQLNTVRKHLSGVKGGRLAAAIPAGRLLTLVLSDVIGDPLDVIASGPTVADRTTPADAIAILTRFDPDHSLPPSVYHHLSRGSQREQPTNVHGDVVVVGNNASAVDAAGVRAESLGFSHAMDIAQGADGRGREETAEQVGRGIAEMAVAMLRDTDRASASPDCLITGGEPVVRLAPADVRGRGGRNQQLVLAAMVALGRDPRFLPDDEKRLVVLSGGTDGEDGPTDAAGAILSESVWRSTRVQRLDPADFLRRNDAYTFFEKAGGLLITGPTGTNVCDIRVVTVR